MDRYLSEIYKYKRGLNLRIILRVVLLALMCAMTVLHCYYLLWLNVPSTSSALTWSNYIFRVLFGVVVFLLIIKAWKGFYNTIKTARWLDKEVEYRDDLFQNLWELKEQNEDKEVLNALTSQADSRFGAGKYVLPRLFSSAHAFVMLFVLVGIASVWALSWDSFRYAFNQFVTNNPQTIAYKDTIELSPGNTTLGKGQQLVIKIENADPRLNHRLFYRWDKEWRELGLTTNSYSFPSLEYSIEYYAQNEVAKSPVYRVICLDEPFVKNWEVSYKYPAYSGLGAALDTLGYGNLQGLKYSEAILSIVTNIAVKQATMRFSNGKAQEMQAVDQRSFSTKLTLLEPLTWYLELTDALGRKSRPEEKSITIIADMAPEIRIVFPGKDTILDQTQMLPLIISADDDFGLRNLSLVYQVNDQPARTEILQALISSKLTTLDHTLDLKPVGLFPGDEVTYWAEVYDNSPERQKAVSARYKARFPSIEEIYREIEKQEKLKSEDLQKTLEESKELQKDFEQKRRELMKKEAPGWEDKKQLENILENQEKLTEQVENIAEDFQDLINKMQRNDAISEETLQKMQKIQELMQEISNDELREAMRKFEDALQNIKPEDLRKAMENFKFSMEDFAQKIDQTLQLLESIKKEQAMEKALQIGQEMEKLQSALKEKTGDNKQSSEKLAQDQKNLKEKLESLEDALKKADELLDPEKDKAVKKEMQELRQEMQQSQMQQQMDKSSQQLENNQRSASQQTQEQILEKMRRFTQRMNSMKSSLSGSSQKEVKTAMQNAVRELLIFSKQHEDTKSRYSLDPYPIISDLISQYEGIQVSLNRLFSKPQVTMFLPPKFFLDLNDTVQAYRSIFINVNEMQYSQIPQQLDAIQKGLNLMVYDLIQAMNNSSAGAGGGSGMQSMMQMLEQMGQQQMAMNMLTEQLMMQMQQGGKMDAAMQQQMQKLASDQERLAENLKRALQNNPEAQKQGNAIKQIIDEAEAVSRQLRANQLSPDLMHRQENILSRLLDAQRSINKREFSEKRKGETADPSIRQEAGATDYEALKRKAMLDDSYRNFPPAYQQVIIKYLKLLNE